MANITIRADFGYCFEFIRRLPTAPAGHIWQCCASWPDADVKHIWLGEYAPLGQ